MLSFFGAHTLGQAFRSNSDYNGKDRWVAGEMVLDK